MQETSSRKLAPYSALLLLVALAFALLLFFAPAGTVRAQSADLPPIIDRELFFGDPEISGAQISPDGKFISFVKPFKGTRNIWVKRTEEPFDAAKPTQRLKEISVDVKTVTLPKKVEVSATEVPKPAMDLKAGTANYKASIAAGSHTIPLSMKTEIKEEGGAWMAHATAVTPQGEMSDTSIIEKGSLLLKRRSIKQGPVVIELDVKGSKASGTMTMNGQTRPIDAELGGVLIADGAGAFEVIAAFPLAVGYSTGFRNFDLHKQKPQLKQLKVLGTESVTVPAGTFDAYRVEITSTENEADKQTVWIAKDTRKVVKITAVLQSMGGAVLTSELTP